MRKVLHIIDDRTPADMLDQLSLLAREGDVIASIGPAPKYAGFELPVRAVHCPLDLAQLAGYRMRGLARGAAGVHAWSPRAAWAARVLARGRTFAPLLSWPHLPRKNDAPFLKKMHKAGVHLTVPTQAARAALLRAGFDESSLYVLPPAACPIEGAGTRRKRTREALGVSASQCLLVAPAEMTREAGHKYASSAHAIVRQILSDMPLMMPGGGPIEQHVRFFAATTGYDDEVFFTEERFSRSDALAAADIAVFLASRDTGVSALAAAMAAGVAIVASNTPDIAECAPHEVAALLAPLGDPRGASAALLRLIEDRDLARRLARGAKNLAKERFDRQSCQRKLAEIHAAVFTG